MMKFYTCDSYSINLMTRDRCTDYINIFVFQCTVLKLYHTYRRESNT